jgi:hypothetical protein
MSSSDKKELQLDLTDPLEILNLLKDAILRKPVDQADAAAALRQVLKNYEQQNRVFLIAAANAELPRVVRLMEFLHACEGAMFEDDRLKDASTKELIRMYALAQANLLASLDNVKKVADMRLDALRAAGGSAGAEKLFQMEDKELDAIAGLPTLDAQGRDRVRKLVTGLIEAIEKDDSVAPDEDDDESSTDNSDD